MGSFWRDVIIGAAIALLIALSVLVLAGAAVYVLDSRSHARLLAS
jgi:hypothetical protein